MLEAGAPATGRAPERVWGQAYLAHLAGVSAEAAGDRRSVTFRHAVAFVLGFSIVFVALGASVGAVGYLIRDELPTIQKIAGVLLIVLGLNLMGILRIPWLYRTYRPVAV